MPLNPDIAPADVTPVAGNPDGVRTRRLGPVTANPNITGAIPAMKAAHPDPAGVRSRTGVFNDNGRRSDADHNALSKGRRQAEKSGRGNQ